MKRFAAPLILIFVFFLLVLVLHQTVAGNVVRLKPAGPFVGPVSQSMTLSDAYLPVYGHDFTLADVHYFENQAWVVLVIKPTAQRKFDPGTVVLEKIQGNYQVVLGPGSSFQASDFNGFPSDVAQYLQPMTRGE